MRKKQHRNGENDENNKVTEDTKKDLLISLLKRSPDKYPEHEKVVAEYITDIVPEVIKAVFEYTKKFDNGNVMRECLCHGGGNRGGFGCYRSILCEVIRRSAANIEAFHRNSCAAPGSTRSLTGSLLDKSGFCLYRYPVSMCRAGKAAYPASVLMNVIPAKVAGG